VATTVEKESIVEVGDLSWMVNATCRGLSPNLFHPERGDVGTQREALKICNGDQRRVKDFKTRKFHMVGAPPCPVKEQCANYILSMSSAEDMCGVYGGMTHKQRQLKRRQEGTHHLNVTRKRPPCGTMAGYAAHLRRKEPTCDACRQQNALWKAEHKQRVAGREEDVA